MSVWTCVVVVSFWRHDGTGAAAVQNVQPDVRREEWPSTRVLHLPHVCSCGQGSEEKPGRTQRSPGVLQRGDLYFLSKGQRGQRGKPRKATAVANVEGYTNSSRHPTANHWVQVRRGVRGLTTLRLLGSGLGRKRGEELSNRFQRSTWGANLQSSGAAWDVDGDLPTRARAYFDAREGCHLAQKEEGCGEGLWRRARPSPRAEEPRHGKGREKLWQESCCGTKKALRHERTSERTGCQGVGTSDQCWRHLTAWRHA